MRSAVFGPKRHARGRPAQRSRRQKVSVQPYPDAKFPLKYRKRVYLRAATVLFLTLPLVWMMLQLPRVSLPPLEGYERLHGRQAALANQFLRSATHRASLGKPFWSKLMAARKSDAYPASGQLQDHARAVELNKTLFMQVSADAHNTQSSIFDGVAPRSTKYVSLAEKFRNVREVPMHIPIVHAVFVCHFVNPCCFATLRPALSSLLRQSLMPDTLKILHGCSQRNDRTRIVISARKVLGSDDNTDSYSRSIVTVSEQLCENGAKSQHEFDDCVVRYLSYSATRQRAPYTIVMSEREVLEPTALEKSWMYLKLHPFVDSVRSLSYEPLSLLRAQQEHDPLLVRRLLPSWNNSLSHTLSVVPVVFKRKAFTNSSVNALSSAPEGDSTTHWKRWLAIMANGRLLREALYTRLAKGPGLDEDIVANLDPISFQSSGLTSREIPPHLRSDLAFYKWSGRREHEEMYKNTLDSFHSRLDLSSMTERFIEAPQNGHRLMFIMPWLQMGGSEKAMLDIAEKVVSMKWAVTFVLTMPDWHEDELGEMGPQHHWIDKALELTSDVFDLVSISTNDKSSRAFRHLLESRRPDYVLLSNTRWAYAHSQLIRAVLPHSTIADYNHMIHPGWNGGGLPRYGANYSAYFDVHFTASQDVATPMERWIDSKIMERDPYKVRPCHIGTDSTLFFKGPDKVQARARMRQKLHISEEVTVVLFVGRLIADKGVDVLIEAAKKAASDPSLMAKLFFLFIGDGDQRPALLKAQKQINTNGQFRMLVRPPAQGLLDLREYYAMSDALILPSVNEGIALVVYEAMAAGLLVMVTDVGGQKEVVTPETGVIMRNSRSVEEMSAITLVELRNVLRDPSRYSNIANAGRALVEKQFTTERFRECVIDGLVKARRAAPVHGDLDRARKVHEPTIDRLEVDLVGDVRLERTDGLWKRGAALRQVDKALTIGIKTYVCDSPTVAQVHALVRSIRWNYPKVRVLLGNDGPLHLRDADFVRDDPYTEEIVLPLNSGISIGRNTLVNMTTTGFFVLLDDDHVLDDTTDLSSLVRALEKDKFDIVGLRVRNLPGIDEMERTGIPIPRYVAEIESLQDRRLTLCLWNENEGPSVYGMEHAILVDVLHNAFVGRTDVLRSTPWRDELQVNEHMQFFLDAKKDGVRVGYLPSQFVHHRARDYTKCYYNARFREDKFRSLLDYDDQFYYDIQCGREFPKRVRNHILKMEFDGQG